jgi:hypothetical protein
LSDKIYLSILNEPSFTTTNQFYIVGKDIGDLNGNKFYPFGANVGIAGALNWKGIANGHVADAVAWGWNTVRLNIMCTRMDPWVRINQVSYDPFVKEVDQFVQEYTSQKIVVIFTCHDLTAEEPPLLVTDRTLRELDRFWIDAAIRYKNNAYVWFNINEPIWTGNAQWLSLQRHFLKLLRDQGAENIYVADIMNSGQDAGWDGARKVFDPSMGPALSAGQCNVLFGIHAYGGIGDNAAHAGYLDSVAAQNLPLVTGEMGYPLGAQPDSLSGIGQSVMGANAMFDLGPQRGIGLIWWHATHDGMPLKASGNAFYADGGPGLGLSPAGQRLWQIGHNKPNLGLFTGDLRQSNCPSKSGL